MAILARRWAGRSKLPADFWRLWTGQTISQMGSSFTQFAIPLIVYDLTHSSVNLALSTVFVYAPYPMFGLIIGAWMDRTNRKRTMIAVDLLRSGVVSIIPLLALVHALSIGWIYAVGFVSSTLRLFFTAGEFAAIPSLVRREDLVLANSRVEASYSAARVLGALLAGLMVSIAPISTVFLVDAGSFLASAGMLTTIHRGFNETAVGPRITTIRRDVRDGLRYVLRHPVLRAISAMRVSVNLIAIIVFSQIVYFAKVRLRASDARVGFVFAAGSLGVVGVSLIAGRLKRRVSYGRVLTSCIMAEGLLVLLLSGLQIYWAALVVWAAIQACESLYDINVASLRQSIVPNQMLSRVIAIALVLAWSATPVGSLIGGIVIGATHSVAMTFAIVGVSEFTLGLLFSFSAIAHADEYVALS
jgi:MFS family permease